MTPNVEFIGACLFAFFFMFFMRKLPRILSRWLGGSLDDF